MGIALAFAVCLLAAPGGAGAAGPSPTPAPLWHVYPLDTGKPRSALPASFPGALQGDDSRVADASAPRPDAPVLVYALLVGAAAGLAWIAGAGLLGLARRRRDSGVWRD